MIWMNPKMKTSKISNKMHRKSLNVTKKNRYDLKVYHHNWKLTKIIYVIFIIFRNIKFILHLAKELREI